MSITAAQVKELRERTGAGMMDCKKALVETNGDMDAAVEHLQIKLGNKMVGRSGRAASEGLVRAAVSSDGRRAALVEVNCETDFVARNDDFAALVDDLASFILHTPSVAEGVHDGASIADVPFKNGQSVAQHVLGVSTTTGENLVFNRFALFSLSSDGSFGQYIHHDGKTGVLVQVSAASDASARHEATEAFAKHVAMHIAASKPTAVSRDEVDSALVDKQRHIFEAQGRETGKPDNIVSKIAEGRLNKWLKEISLLDQPFVMDTDKTISALQGEVSKQVGGDLSVDRFALFVVGQEGAEGDAA